MEVEVAGKKGSPPVIVCEDEEWKKARPPAAGGLSPRHARGDALFRAWQADFDKLRKLPPAFDKTGKGTVTAGNASSISDGAAAVVLMSCSAARAMGVPILAVIRSFGEAEQVRRTARPSRLPRSRQRGCLRARSRRAG